MRAHPEGEKGLMNVRAAFVAKGETPEAVQPGQGPLNDPAEDAQATAVRAPRLGNDGRDALGFEAGVPG